MHTKQQNERSLNAQLAEDKSVAATANEQTGTSERPIVIGNDYASLSWIAASANTPGVWAWDASATDARVWHWAPGQEAASWSLGSTPEVREGVENPALAACADSAWFGINDTLFKLTAADGIVAKVAVPHGEAIAAVETHRPNGVKGTSAVNAVACNGTTVAVGRSNSQVAFVYDTSTKKFRTVQLPEAAAVVDAAVSANGAAAFALQDFNGKGPTPW